MIQMRLEVGEAEVARICVAEFTRGDRVFQKSYRSLLGFLAEYLPICEPEKLPRARKE